MKNPNTDQTRMRLNPARHALFLLVALVLSAEAPSIDAETANSTDKGAPEGLLARDNILAWGVAPFDSKQRGPEERAQMLESLGIRNIAFNWRERDVPMFDDQIDALKRHGIHLVSWAVYDAAPLETRVNWNDRIMADPGVLMGSGKPGKTLSVKDTLEIFKIHHVRPQLWLIQLPPNKPALTGDSTGTVLRQDVRQQWMQRIREDLTNTPEQQEARVSEEAERISGLVKLAAPYGIDVELYNHNGWYGMMSNQLAIISRLKDMAITNVGIVYNFSHAWDEFHDDTEKFPDLWKKMQPYVVAVNITGMHKEPGKPEIFPSQGDRELGMLRTIQDSGWKGPIGLITETGGDAGNTLRNCLVGLDWLAAELREPGSGGGRPFPPPR